MNKKMRFLFLLLGLSLIFGAVYLNLRTTASAVEIAPAITLTATNELIELLPAATETPVVVVTSTPTEVPLLVDGFNLSNAIDLSSSKSTVMALYLPNGNLLSFPTWAEAVSEEVADISAFEIHEGTIYSLKSGATLVTLLHSGMVYNSPDKLAGANFDRFVTRESSENNGFVSFLQGSRLLASQDGQEKAQTLVGAYGYICQKDGVVPFIVYTGDCDGGQLLKVQVRSVALVLGEQSMQYDWQVANGEVLPWLQSNFVGFEDVSPRTGFLISTCIYQFADQLDSETLKPYLYNRLVIWLEVVP